MKESNIQTLFSTYLEKHRPQGSRAYELKLCKGGTLPFDRVRPHQVEALVNAASAHGLYHKINDMPIFKGHRSRFTNPKPFDCLFINRAKSYIAVCFYKPRKPKELLLINMFDWNNYKGQNPQRRSMPKDVAYVLADEIITL